MRDLHRLVSEDSGKNTWLSRLYWYLSPEAGRSNILRIKNFLMYLFQARVEQFGTSSVSSYSPAELARMFRCPVDDVIHSLHELNDQGYEFVCRSDHEPVVLRDALAEQSV